MTMHLRNATLAAAVAAVLGLAPDAVLAQDSASPLKWYGSIYAKFLDGNRRTEAGLYSNSETTPGEGGGDQGQGLEFELMFNAQVSKQVEIGGRLHSRFNKNYWSNYGGFGVPGQAPNGGCEEDDPRCNQYMKLRGAWVRLTPGYTWMDSATIGNQDWGLFDAWTFGKIRYIDRDNLGGFLLQGSAFDRQLRWDVARITIPNYQNLKFASDISSDDLYANDGTWVAQLKYAPSPDFNTTLIVKYAFDDEADDDDPNGLGEPDLDYLDGIGTWQQFDNTVVGLKAQYSGIDFMDVSGAVYYSDLSVDDSICEGTMNDDCRFQPLLKRSTDDFSYYLNLNFNQLFVDGLSLSVQFFDIGSDYVSLMAARRESDVLLTEGQEGTWMWGRPDYNSGNRGNANSMAGLGWGGWNGEVQQVVSLAADNDFTDFDEPVAYSVIGWKGVTLVPKYQVGDWEFAAEYTYLDFNTDWQACGGSDKDIDCATYIRQDGTQRRGPDGALQVHQGRGQARHEVALSRRRLRRLPGRTDQRRLDPERGPRRLRRLRRSPGRLRHLRGERRLPAAPGSLRDADLRVPPGRADRRHDRRGAGGPRLRGEQRLRVRRVHDRQARQEPHRPGLQLFPLGRRVRRCDRLPVGRVRPVVLHRPQRQAGAFDAAARPVDDRDAARQHLRRQGGHGPVPHEDLHEGQLLTGRSR